MITIVNYGMGNLGSLLNMFKRLGVNASIEADPVVIGQAKKLILPGVGAFDAAMMRINNLSGLREILEYKARVEKVPILGVCLGMQLLTDSSQEGEMDGLGWIPGKTTRLPLQSGFKVPHMGWNIAQPTQRSSPLTSNLESDPRYYFVHSYCVHVENPEHSLMRTSYGVEFDAAIGCENIFGVQFHPEKSHKFGMQILKNFAEI
jgi:glutamine amidotransferase